MNDMNWLAIYPEILLLVMGCVVALVDLWVTDEQRRPTYWLTQLSLAIVAGMHFYYFDAGFTTYAMQGMVVADPMGHLLAGFACVATMIALVYARPYAGVREMLKGELFILSLFSLLGICVMLSANNFLVIYLGLELMSLSLYALVALRRDHAVSTEAAMKYFVLGALASGFLLYGLSMMYGATGSLSIPEVFDVIAKGVPNRGVLVFGGVVPLLITPIILLWLPESCRFMAVRGHAPDRIARELGKVSGEVLQPGLRFVSSEPSSGARTPVSQLFANGFAALSLSLWVTYFMGLLVIYLLTGWLPTLFKENGLSLTQAANVTALFQLGGTVGAVVVGWFMDRKRPTGVIAAAYLAGGASVLILGLVAEGMATTALWVTVAGFCMSGAQTGLNAYAPSCYPTAARATGVSWMLGMGRFGSITGSMLGGVLVGLGWSFGHILGLLAVPAALAALAILGSRRQASQPLPQATA